LKKSLQFILPLFIGAAILFFYLSGFTSEQLYEIWFNIKEVDYRLLLISLLLGLLSHIIRAFRWNYLLIVLGYHPKKINLILTVGLSYLLNLIFPRAGEVGRAVSLVKYEKQLKFEKVFGTIVAERIIDMLFFLFFVGMAIVMQFDLIYNMIAPKIPKNPIFLIVQFLIFIFLSFLLIKRLNKSKNFLVVRLKSFVSGLIRGINSIKLMPKKGIFILQTITIWLLYVLMFWILLLAFPQTQSLDMEAVIVSFVAGSIAMVISNGGFGIYPVFVAEALLLYDISPETGTAFGLLMWTSQTILVIIFGLMSVFLLPLYNMKK